MLRFHGSHGKGYNIVVKMDFKKMKLEKFEIGAYPLTFRITSIEHLPRLTAAIGAVYKYLFLRGTVIQALILLALGETNSEN